MASINQNLDDLFDKGYNLIAVGWDKSLVLSELRKAAEDRLMKGKIATHTIRKDAFRQVFDIRNRIDTLAIEFWEYVQKRNGKNFLFDPDALECRLIKTEDS